MKGAYGCVAAWSAATATLLHDGPGPRDLRRIAAAGSGSVLSGAAAHPDEALVLVAGVLAWLLLGYLGLAALVVLGSEGAGRGHRWYRRASRVLIPRALRHTLGAALGLGFAALTATPALAGPAGPVPAVPSLDRAPATALRLAPLPAVPAPLLAPSPPPASAQPSEPAPSMPLPDFDRAGTPRTDPGLTGRLPPIDEVVVRRGDCLWDLVHRSLGPAASDADIARAWPRWWAHNRTAIGDDPDLLLPGTVLTPPPAAVPTP